MLFATTIASLIIASILDDIVVIMMGGSFIVLACIFCFFTIKDIFTAHPEHSSQNEQHWPQNHLDV